VVFGEIRRQALDAGGNFKQPVCETTGLKFGDGGITKVTGNPLGNLAFGCGPSCRNHALHQGKDNSFLPKPAKLFLSIVKHVAQDKNLHLPELELKIESGLD
jgi:hypothetical protein